MVQPEQSAHPKLSIQIDHAVYSLDVLSLLFDTCDNPRTFTETQCYGMRELLSLVKSKLEEAADRASVVETSLHHLNEHHRKGRNAADAAFQDGLEKGEASARTFQGWTGDEPPVADQPVYPQVRPAVPEAEEPGALSA